MKLFVCILLNCSLIILTQSQQKNLTQLIVEKQKQGNAIEINLDYNNFYFWDGKLSVENLTRFILVGNNQTFINCTESLTKQGLMITNVSQVTFQDIILEDCNKNLNVNQQLPGNLAFFHFKKCGTVYVSRCKFKNVYGINFLLSNSTENLTVEDSEFLIEKEGPSKAIMALSDNVNVYNSSIKVNRNVFRGLHWWVEYLNSESEGTNFSVKCGSVLSLFNFANGSSLVHIADNNFSSYISTGSGAVCIWIGEWQYNSTIIIERGSFMNGSVNITQLGERYHERPKGGAIALFLYGKYTQLSINNCNFTNNTAYRGGAVYIDYSESPLLNQIDKCRFENNTGTLGGALMITTSLPPEGVSLNLTNSTFIGNKADFAGAILGFRVSININDTVTVASNKAQKGNGGGIGLIFSHLFVYGQLIVANNSADEGGGGVYMSNQCQIIMGQYGSVLNITGNNARTYGGGIFANSLEYHNLFINWNVTRSMVRRWCFLKGEDGKNGSSIVLQENKVINRACAGNTGYTQMLGKCFDPRLIKGNILSDNNDSCKNDTREMYFHIELSSQSFIHCNDSFFKEATKYDPTHRLKMSDYCKQSGVFDPFVMDNDHVTSKTVLKFHRTHPLINKFYYMYPGYVANLTIWSTDYFQNNVVTRANLTGWILADGQKSTDSYRYIIMSDNNETQRSFLTKFSHPITMRSQWKGLGVICVESIGSFYKKVKCIGVVMDECPPGFSLGNNQDQCLCDQNNKWYSCTKGNNISINHGYYIANKYVISSLDDSSITGAKCLWSRCKCQYGAPNNACLLYTLYPNDQCLPGQEGILCGNCSNPNETLLFSPLLHSIKQYNSCIECKNPVLRIFIAVMLIIAVALVIMLFRVNLFDDYWRSIIFYANILYMILVNSNPYLSQVMSTALAIPILPLNLLVTQIVPFCLSRDNNALYTAIFDMTVPWVVLFGFILFQFVLSRVSWLSTRNLPTQIWSMLLLTYTDLSIHAFMILTCPLIGDKTHWLYHGDTICFQQVHLKATLLSLFYMFVLTTIPLFLLFIVFCKVKDFQFHHIITREFKHSFRWWEIYKLFLRLIISLMLSYLSNFIDPSVINLLVAIICLFTMIINSLCQPANNVVSNHFESLCLLSLTLMVTLHDHWIVIYVPLFPFLVGAALIVIQQKIPLWHGQISKIRTEFKKEKRVKDKTISIFKILDVKNNYELDSI